MTTKFRTLALALALVSSVYLMAGCSKNDTIALPAGDDDAATAPELPSVSTMKVELDFFGVPAPAVDQSLLVQTSPEGYPQAAAAGEHENWINAFIRALYVQLVMYDAIKDPVGAFALAIHSVPQRQDDGSFLWTYIFVEDGVDYSIFLYGTPATDRAIWRMEVSTNNPDLPLDHFVWFEGESMRDNSHGFWQFYAPVLPGGAATASTPPTEGEPSIRIDWENLSRTEHRVTVTVNGTGLEGEGDYVEFYNSSEMGKIDFYDASADVLSNITWYADGSGSLTVPDYNGGLQACWDTQQINVECQ
jgi:hypothetical protein